MTTCAVPVPALYTSAHGQDAPVYDTRPVATSLVVKLMVTLDVVRLLVVTPVMSGGVTSPPLVANGPPSIHVAVL